MAKVSRQQALNFLRNNRGLSGQQMKRLASQHGFSPREAQSLLGQSYRSAGPAQKRAAQQQALRAARAMAPNATAAMGALKDEGILTGQTRGIGAVGDEMAIGRAMGTNIGGAKAVARGLNPYIGQFNDAPTSDRYGRTYEWAPGGKTYQEVGSGPANHQGPMSWQQAQDLAAYGSQPTYSPYRPWAGGTATTYTPNWRGESTQGQGQVQRPPVPNYGTRPSGAQPQQPMQQPGNQYNIMQQALQNAFGGQQAGGGGMMPGQTPSGYQPTFGSGMGMAGPGGSMYGQGSYGYGQKTSPGYGRPGGNFYGQPGQWGQSQYQPMPNQNYGMQGQYPSYMFDPYRGQQAGGGGMIGGMPYPGSSPQQPGMLDPRYASTGGLNPGGNIGIPYTQPPQSLGGPGIGSQQAGGGGMMVTDSQYRPPTQRGGPEMYRPPGQMPNPAPQQIGGGGMGFGNYGTRSMPYAPPRPITTAL